MVDEICIFEMRDRINSFVKMFSDEIAKRYDYPGVAAELAEEIGASSDFIEKLTDFHLAAYFAARCSDDEHFDYPTSKEYAEDVCQTVGVPPTKWWGVVNGYLCDAYWHGECATKTENESPAMGGDER